MKLLKELLENNDNVVSMAGYLKKKVETGQTKIGGLLDAANKAADDAKPKHSKTLSDLAKKEHEDVKKNKAKLDAVGKVHKQVNETKKLSWLDWLSEAKKPIPDHPYHNKTDDELNYIIKDASEAAQKMKDHDSKAESKYLDQVNDASTVLHHRKKNVK